MVGAFARIYRLLVTESNTFVKDRERSLVSILAFDLISSEAIWIMRLELDTAYWYDKIDSNTATEITNTNTIALFLVNATLSNKHSKGLWYLSSYKSAQSYILIGSLLDDPFNYCGPSGFAILIGTFLIASA